MSMKFKHGTRRRALEYEKDWAERWKQDKTFEKSVEQRSKDSAYVFYDGPPFISGSPHHGTLLSSIIKDIIPRYQTMKGKRVERVWGWDCHGLPAERFTEKKLGINSRQEVIDYGIEKYIVACRNNMVQTSGEWNSIIDRIGRWVDMDNAYKTMDKEYMESVWWAFKELYEKGKIYEGEKVLMYCTLDATPLSKAEVTMDAGAYQDVTDPSVFVKFEVMNANNHKFNLSIEDDLFLLAWTTTPWTLPANMALAVSKDIEYSLVRTGGDYMILAKSLLDKVFVDEKKQPIEYEIIKDAIPVSDLVGLAYVPPLMGRRRMNHNPQRPDFNINTSNYYKVFLADFVGDDTGTGIVHIAPAYGEDDFELAMKNNIAVLHVVDENGNYIEGDWQGQNVWEINKQIAKDLKERGVVWKIDYIRHSYPHCHRCGTKLMYRAHPSWFMDIDGQRQQMLENNQPINWFPPYVKNGRFAKTIETAPDWNLSRDRFWATAMPVWKTETGKVKVVGSYAELKQLSGRELDDYHRPWVDDITFEIDGETYTRIDKVIDCWFESGSMPFAQFHYPFENKAKFEANFPGDFIVEYVGQVRAWFYYVHAVSTALFGTNGFKNVIVTGNVAGSDGRKMSKSYGNYTDPNELMDKFSADSLRFLLASSPLLSGEDFALQDKEVGDVARKLSMIWNMYDFFTMYAEVDDFTFPYSAASSDAFLVHGMSHTAHSDTPDSLHSIANEKSYQIDVDVSKLKNPLDIWIVSRLHQLVAEVEKHLDGYNLPDAMSPILPFIDDASNWYVRRSRRRFWKSDQTDDKNDAYKTLHYVLVRLAYVLAPFTPFLAEELYHNLTGDKQSIHLKDWLPAGNVDQLVTSEMETVRDYVNQGLSMRAKTGLKVRQPLASITVPSLGQNIDFESILTDELNVKSVKVGQEIAIDDQLTPELEREGLMREVIRHVQNARKEAGLNIDDRIKLGLVADNLHLEQAIADHKSTISNETLAVSLDSVSAGGALLEKKVEIEGSKLAISIDKV